MSDYETIQRRRNIIVGIFVFSAIAAICWLIFKFEGLPTMFSRLHSFEVFVQFPSAPGVDENTPVRFCGRQIGRVTDVKPPKLRKDLDTGLIYHQTKVALSIDKRYVDIPSNVEVKLMTRGLGSSYIKLIADPTLPLTFREPNRPETKFLIDKMLLQGSTEITSEFFPEESQKKLDELVDGLRALVNNANDILGDKANKENLKATLSNLTEATQQSTESLRKFEEFSAAGAQMSDELGVTLSELREILEKVNAGEGTAAKFINDGRLYENLLENTQQLEVLIQDLKDFIAEYRKGGIKVKL